jgi:hypothetical protein
VVVLPQTLEADRRLPSQSACVAIGSSLASRGSLLQIILLVPRRPDGTAGGTTSETVANNGGDTAGYIGSETMGSGLPLEEDGTGSGGPGPVVGDTMGGGDLDTRDGVRRLAMQRLLRLRSRLQGDNTGVQVCPGLYVGSMVAASNWSPLSFL